MDTPPTRPIRRGDIVQLDPAAPQFGMMCFVVEAVRDNGHLDLAHMTITPLLDEHGATQITRTVHTLNDVPADRCELIGEAAWLMERDGPTPPVGHGVRVDVRAVRQRGGATH